jgi:hypothetical protein
MAEPIVEVLCNQNDLAILYGLVDQRVQEGELLGCSVDNSRTLRDRLTRAIGDLSDLAEDRPLQWLACDDAYLGRLVRLIARIVNDRTGERSTEVTAACLLLIEAALEVGATDSTFTLRGVTTPEPSGDWIVTVQLQEETP